MKPVGKNGVHAMPMRLPRPGLIIELSHGPEVPVGEHLHTWP